MYVIDWSIQIFISIKHIVNLANYVYFTLLSFIFKNTLLIHFSWEFKWNIFYTVLNMNKGILSYIFFMKMMKEITTMYTYTYTIVYLPLLFLTWWTSQIWIVELGVLMFAVRRKHSLCQSQACGAYRSGSDPLPRCSSCLCLYHTEFWAGGTGLGTLPS